MKDPEVLRAMLQPYSADEMEGYPVTPAVNSPSYTGADCVERVGM